MDAKVLENAANVASKRGIQRFTRFLDPAEQQEASVIAKHVDVAFSSYGGYSEAERCIGCFYLPGDEPEKDSYPLVCLTSAYDSRYGGLTHRDLLGAFMGLGLTRDSLGDIIIVNDRIFLFTSEQMHMHVMESLQQAGRVHLDWRLRSEAFPIPSPKGIYVRGILSSMRLDAVIAEAFELSRNDAQNAIRAGKIKLNYFPCLKIDHSVEEGAMLSFSGKGRVSLRSVDGLTRKQRIGVTFFRYQ